MSETGKIDLLIYSFAPFANSESKVLILGTMPFMLIHKMHSGRSYFNCTMFLFQKNTSSKKKCCFKMGLRYGMFSDIVNGEPALMLILKWRCLTIFTLFCQPIPGFLKSISMVKVHSGILTNFFQTSIYQPRFSLQPVRHTL